jgi:hypothetical protein
VSETCPNGWGDESFGFIECGDAATEPVNYGGTIRKECPHHARETRRIWPELNKERRQGDVPSDG